MHTLVKHPLVDCDLEEAALWYSQRDHQVAFRLIDETRAAMRAAAENPLHYAIRFDFPHSVFFKVAGETVFILAVLHGAREIEKIIQGRASHS